MAGLLLCLSVLAEAQERDVFAYRGICDASAAVALDERHFAVADDETNVLLTYEIGNPDAVSALDLGSYLDAEKESDIEGAARIGDRIYWISSHGTNRRGKQQKSRYQLFATDVKLKPGVVPAVEPVGRSYTRLLQDLERFSAVAKYRLAEAARLPPTAEGGFSIEGLAATPDLTGLLIGLRNPVPRGRALIVPVLHADDLVRGERIVFGDPVELDLDGYGIRSLELVGKEYWILAGPISGGTGGRLLRWSGAADDPPVALSGVDLSGLQPEAVFSPSPGTIVILSDDGNVTSAGVPCKDADPKRKRFRAVTLRP